MKVGNAQLRLYNHVLIPFQHNNQITVQMT